MLFNLARKKEVYNLRYKNYANLIRKIEYKEIYCNEYYSSLFFDREVKEQRIALKQEKTVIKIHLKGILNIDNSKIALINEFAYHEGDSIAPQTSLIEIKDNYVLITINHEIKKIGLGEELEINET